ncbi:MAG: rhomboid family intramembrane serine protease [Actinobacteria bacterium]|nr:rhomboid family intramembrane serine protease [Actinomycetota bacterium]
MKERQSLTTSLIVLISGCFLLGEYVFPNLQSQLALFYGGNYSNGYFPGVSTGQWYRLLTVALTHAGWLHLIFNMLALYSIGTPIENFLGRVRYSIIFLGSLIAASVGASGAIYGLFGSLFVIGKKSGANYQNITGVIIVNLLITFTVPGIDWRAHLGGLVAGVVITYPLMFRRRT